MSLFRFIFGDKEINVIADTETNARIKAKLSDDFVLKDRFTLNDNWE